jgi:regulatory protein
MTLLITAIEPSEKDPNYRDVYVQGKFAMTLPCATVEELQLTVKHPWDEETSIAVETLTAIEDARKTAIDLISRRSWGCCELITRLVKRGSDRKIAEQTIEQLTEDGWLNDLTYACALIRQWLRKEPAGRRWLQHKLREKEITQQIAALAIDEELRGHTEQDAADAFAAVRLSKISSQDDASVRRKIMSALTRKGFASDVATEAFSKAHEDYS